MEINVEVVDTHFDQCLKSIEEIKKEFLLSDVEICSLLGIGNDCLDGECLHHEKFIYSKISLLKSLSTVCFKQRVTSLLQDIDFRGISLTAISTEAKIDEASLTMVKMGKSNNFHDMYRLYAIAVTARICMDYLYACLIENNIYKNHNEIIRDLHGDKKILTMNVEGIMPNISGSTFEDKIMGCLAEYNNENYKIPDIIIDAIENRKISIHSMSKLCKISQETIIDFLNNPIYDNYEDKLKIAIMSVLLYTLGQS